MVGVASNRSDRGQLVLVGAITIAFILLGVVVVFNGVQYTETVNTGSAGESVEDVRMTEAELEATIEGLMKHSDPTETEIEAHIEEHYNPTRAEQRPVHVTVDVDLDGGDATVTYSYTAQGVTIVGNMTVSDEP